MLIGFARRTHNVFVAAAAALACLSVAACSGEPPDRAAAIAERAAEAARAEETGREAGPEGQSDAGAPLLPGLPDSCPLLTAEEPSEILGAPASTPEGAANEGRAGSLCRYVADREHRLGFEIFMLPLAVWDPDTGSLEELAALGERIRSSRPEAAQVRALKVHDRGDDRCRIPHVVVRVVHGGATVGALHLIIVSTGARYWSCFASRTRSIHNDLRQIVEQSVSRLVHMPPSI